MGDLGRLAHAAQRDAGCHLLQRFRLHAAGHLGFDEARSDTGHADAIACQLLGPDHGVGGYAGLGRGVVGLPHVAGAGDGGDVDDGALIFQLDHLGRHFAGAEEHAGQVNVDHRLPLGQAHLADFAVLDLDGQTVAQNTGIVDQAVDGAEVGGDLSNHVGYLLFVCHVAQVGTGIATGGLAGGYGFVEFFLIEVNQRQLGALGGQVFAHGAAQTLATTGDDDDFILQLHG